METKIVAFRQDELGDWIVELSCGHARHVRHSPPFQNRPWVMSEAGRNEMIGKQLDCGQCQPEAGK